MRVHSGPAVIFIALTLLVSTRLLNAQTSGTPSLPLSSESNNDVEVTYRRESDLKLVKKRPDGTTVPPYHDERTRTYRVVSGFDVKDKPVVVMRVIDDKAAPPDAHSRAKTITLSDGHIHMFNAKNQAITPPKVPGVLDTTQASYLSELTNGRLMRITDPNTFAARTQSDISNPTLTTAVLTSHSTKDTTIKRVLTFTHEPDGKWTLTKRELYKSSAVRSIHETILYNLRRAYVNTAGDERRHLAEPDGQTLKLLRAAKRKEAELKQQQFHQHQASVHDQVQLNALLAQPDLATHLSPSLTKFHQRTFSGKPFLTLAGFQQPGNLGATGANIAFVHGLGSNGATWNTMQPWLQSDFAFHLSVTPSIGGGGLERLSSWSPELTQFLDPSGYPLTQPYIAVGHSAGGLVSRAVAQGSLSPIYGVVTLDTPHLGSNLLTNLQADAVELFLSQLFTSSCFYDFSSCLQVGVIGSATLAGVSTIGASIVAPATLDLETPNAYEISLNSNPESFPRVGLVGISDPNWISFRTLVDFAFGSNGPGSGQAAANAAGFLDDALYAASGYYYTLAGIYLNLWEQDDFDPNDGYGDLYYESLDNGDEGMVLAGDLESFDNFWQITAACNINQSVCDPYGSDGVVQGQSQLYPNAPNLFMANFDASHTTSTRSQVSRSYLDQVLSSQVFTPPQTCNSSASYMNNPGSTTIPVPFQGGIISFSVSDPSSCNWSSTSSVPAGPLDPAPWLDFTGPSSGSTNGIVNVLVAFDQDTPSQQATVTIAGTTFTIVQTGVPAGLPQGAIDLYSPFGPFSYSVPTSEYMTVTVGGSSYTLSGATWQVVADAAAAAAEINADSSSPVVAGVWKYDIGYGNAGNARLWLIGKSSQSAGLSYSASVTATNGVPCGLGFCQPPQLFNTDFSAVPDSTTLQ